MSKKVKVIDIFNIISNGDYEALPLNIKVDGNKYNWDTLEHFYNKEDRDGEDLLELATVYDTVIFLDMIVEVLDNNVEDNTEEIEELDTDIHIDSFMDAELNFNKIAQEINKLGKAISELRKEKE